MRLDDESLVHVRAWLVKADEDIEAASVLLREAERLTSSVGFHVQQALEKVLKAFLVACQRFPGKVHDLGLLAKRAADMDDDFRPYVDLVETWTDFAVEERYPGDLFVSSPVDLSAGIALAIELRDLVAKKIAADLPD